MLCLWSPLHGADETHPTQLIHGHHHKPHVVFFARNMVTNAIKMHIPHEKHGIFLRVTLARCHPFQLLNVHSPCPNPPLGDFDSCIGRHAHLGFLVGDFHNDVWIQ